MSSPPGDLGRRVSLVTSLEAQLADIDRAQRAWLTYVEALRGIVPFIGEDASGLLPEDELFWRLFSGLDALRLRAKEALFAVNPNLPWRADFGPLLEADIRTRPLRLFDAASQPLPAERAAATREFLEARAKECEAVISRCRYDVGVQLLPAKERAEVAARDSVIRGVPRPDLAAMEGNAATRFLRRLFHRQP